MPSFRTNHLSITPEKKGAGNYTKSSYPKRFGRYTEIRTADYEFQFNLNGEIRSIRGLTGTWPHPSEFLKRTDGNDWVLYSVGQTAGIGKIIQWMGEYYLPCLPYPSNSLREFNPYSNVNVLNAFGAWSQLYADLQMMLHNGVAEDQKEWFGRLAEMHDGVLHERAGLLHDIIGGRVSVLPPDTRHVDYDVIPLTIADGCLYQCDFCSVKDSGHFHPRSNENIIHQIRRLKAFFGPDLCNYRALFLGNHDGLAAGADRILTAADKALQTLELKNPILFLFGSADSLLRAEDRLLEALDQRFFHTYINIGLESPDAATLSMIGKPLDEDRIREAFQKMLHVNRVYASVEVTANFLLGSSLPPSHYDALNQLLGRIDDPLPEKGAVYLSPLMKKTASDSGEALLEIFYEIKAKSRLPVFIYLIQRL